MDELCEVELDQEADEGHLLIRDGAPHEHIQAVLDELAEQGWQEVDPVEAVVPHEFSDGGVGVMSFLHRAQRVVIDGSATARG